MRPTAPRGRERRAPSRVVRCVDNYLARWRARVRLTGASTAAREARALPQVFGPVLSIIPFEDEDEAVEIANNTIYGLAAGVWTQNMRRAFLMAEKLQAGTVWVNTYRAVSYMSPFGGYKRSGIGRESGQEMIKEYMQVKSIWISTAADVPNPFIIR